MADIKNPAFKKFFGIAISLIAWFALILQYYVMHKTNSENGISTTTTLINFFSFFTILSNLIVAVSLACTFLFPTSKIGNFFSKPSNQSAIGLYILIVGIVYSLALRKIWNPQGLQLVADRLLHDLIPLLYFIFWLIFTPKKVLYWNYVGYWLLFPAFYLTYSLVRGAITNWYPYYFINANELGYNKVVINVLMVLAGFIVIGMLLVLFNRLGKSER